MANPYIVNPQTNPLQELMDKLSGQGGPVFQNTSSQDAFQRAMLQNQMQGIQNAGQAYQQSSGMSINPMSLAQALRGQTQLSDAQKAEVNQLGSNSWNPWSSYNQGTNGWGNYGE